MTPPDGLFSREQLQEAGLDKAARRRRLKAGILVLVLPGVFRIASVPESWTQFVRATSIWLGERGALSHLTSASLQSLTDREGFPIEVSSTMRSLKSPTSQIVVHRVGALENRDLRWMTDMRITNPLRTVFDLAGSLNPNEFEIVLDEARRRRLIAERPLRKLLERLGSQGRAGTRQIRAILDSGEMQSPVPGSPFERGFMQFLRRRFVPLPERQVAIHDDAGRFVALRLPALL